MAADRTPILVGIAQLEQRIQGDPREGREPLAPGARLGGSGLRATG